MTGPRRPRWLTLTGDERVVRVSGANRTVGRIAAGGWLALTSGRLVHHTHLFERTGDWEVLLSSVTGADVAPPGTSWRALFDGSLRPRLRVTTAGGGEVFFVVNRVEEWVSAVTAATER